MAKYTGPRCKICRREGVQLMLKGQRCLTEKCGLKRKKNVPGKLAKRKGKLSEYGMQLREKQKIRKTYGVLEKQFYTSFEEAARMSGLTGENMSWKDTGEVSKEPKGMVIKDGVYQPLD